MKKGETKDGAAARVGLAQVGNRAVRDPGFWEKLVANPEAALKEARLELAPGDLQQLKTAIRKNQVGVDLRKTVEHLHKTPSREGWPAGWIP